MSGNGRRGGAIAGIILTVLMLGIVGMVALVTTGLYVADHVRVTETTARG